MPNGTVPNGTALCHTALSSGTSKERCSSQVCAVARSQLELWSRRLLEMTVTRVGGLLQRLLTLEMMMIMMMQMMKMLAGVLMCHALSLVHLSAEHSTLQLPPLYTGNASLEPCTSHSPIKQIIHQYYHAIRQPCSRCSVADFRGGGAIFQQCYLLTCFT